MIQKGIKQIKQKSMKNDTKLVPKMEVVLYSGGRLFGVFLPVCFFRGAKGPPRDPKLTILVPKIDPQSSQNGAQEPPIATQSDSKHIFKIDRCLKAEFESRGSFQKRPYVKKVRRRCSAQRAQSIEYDPETDQKINPKIDRSLN